MRIGFGFRRFLACRKGGILVFFAMAMAIFFGLTALSFDMGRVASTQSELQSFADNLALAAAGELDGGTDACTRATNAAARAALSDRQTFGDGDRDLDSTDWDAEPPRFYASLPDDETAWDTSMAAADPNCDADAAYVRIVVEQHGVGMTFAAAFGALTGNAAPNAAVAAEATAGFTRYACDITPMFFCLPAGWDADANVGQTILLKSGGGGAAWGAGNFGFLGLDSAAAEGGDCVGPNGKLLTGASLYRCLLGAEGSVARCFAQRGVETEPGEKTNLTSAPFNTRFDMYRSPLDASDRLYPPAPNVIKGLVDKNTGDACIGNGGSKPSPNTAGLPPDDCFGDPPSGLSNSCADDGSTSRFGKGDWSVGRADYVATNYGGTDPHPTAATRYDYYKAEAAVSGDILSGGRDETGRPSCSSHISTEGVERRTLVAGGVNCDPYSGGTVPGGTKPVQVEEWVRVFMLSPVNDDGANPPSFDMWVEVVESVSPGGPDSIIHDIVQLYR